MSAPEQRRDTRVKAAFEVMNAFPPIEGVAFLSELSTRGACIDGTNARPALDAVVQLTSRVSDREPPLVLIGKVVAHTDNGFAVTFETPSAQLEGLLQQQPPIETYAQNLPAAPPSRSARLGAAPYREVAVDCCASSQWISGRICTPPTRSLIDHLNLGDPFLRIVDAVAPHRREPMPFVALRADAADLIVPADGQDAIDTEQRVGRIVERQVRCLLPYAVVEGTIGVLDKIRVSDFAMRCGAFISLRDCRIALARGQHAPRDVSRVALAMVNVRRVLGIADLEAPPPPE